MSNDAVPKRHATQKDTMQSDRLKKTALRYFLEVSRCGSIALAADRLHVASSAISRQIKGLEEALDVKLFERRPTGMVLSAAGELLVVHARNVSLDADRVMADILALEGLQRGHVRIACTEGFALDLLPELLAEFNQKHPRIHFDLAVAAPAEVADRVRNGEADIGLTFSRLAQEDIKVELRRASPIVMVARPDHPLAERKKIALAELASYPLALPASETSLRQIFDLACSLQGLIVTPLLSSDNARALHRFVLSSGVASIASRVSVRDYVNRKLMVVVPVVDRRLGDRGIELQTLRGRTLPRVVQAFLEFIKQRLADTEF